MSTASSVTMTGAEFHRLVGSVLPCAASDGRLPSLCSVRLEITPCGVFAVASDRYTFAVARHDTRSARRRPAGATIPQTAAATMLRLVRRRDPDTAIRISTGGQVTLRTASGITYRSAPPAPGGAFPDWRALLARLLTGQPAPAGEPVHVNPAYLARFKTVAGHDPRLRVAVSHHGGAVRIVVVSAGDWFLGAVASIRTDAPASTADLRDAWLGDLDPAPGQAA